MKRDIMDLSAPKRSTTRRDMIIAFVVALIVSVATGAGPTLYRAKQERDAQDRQFIVDMAYNKGRFMEKMCASMSKPGVTSMKDSFCAGHYDLHHPFKDVLGGF